MLYVVTGSRGQLLDWNVDRERLRVPSNAVIVERPAWDAPPPLPYVWSPEARDWVVPPPPPDAPLAPLTQLEFSSRFTEAEQIALEMAEDGGTPQVRAVLRVINKNLARASDVRLDDPRTRRGAQIAVDILVDMGVVAAEARDARLTAVLAPKEAL